MRSSLIALLCLGAAPLVSACATTAPASAALAAQQAEPPGAVLMVRTERHVRAALRTVDDLAQASPALSEVHVLVCGPGLAALQQGSALTEPLQAAMAGGTRVAACGMSLENENIAPESLLPGVEVVPNALLEVLQLQARGYVSVEL